MLCFERDNLRERICGILILYSKRKLGFLGVSLPTIVNKMLMLCHILVCLYGVYANECCAASCVARLLRLCEHVRGERIIRRLGLFSCE